METYLSDYLPNYHDAPLPYLYVIPFLFDNIEIHHLDIPPLLITQYWMFLFVILIRVILLYPPLAKSEIITYLSCEL